MVIGKQRVLRGGSWNNNARHVRAACRNWNQPDKRNDNLGFRCARAHARTGRFVFEQMTIQVISITKPIAPRCVSSFGENSANGFQACIGWAAHAHA